MSIQQVKPYRSVEDDEARQRRRIHANQEAMQNLILDAIVIETGTALAANVRAFISALQSAHGGGENVNEPFQRNHDSVAS